jgi:S-adenosylmethionine:tRNA ribosyltransferase-isomerase
LILRTSDFDYFLPESLIAQFPAAQRQGSRLLVQQDGGWLDRQFTDLPSFLRAGDLLVVNDTKVVKARLYGHKPTGGKVECLLERCLSDQEALVHLKTSHSPKPGARIQFEEGAELEVLGRQGELFHVRLWATMNLWDWMERQGQLPLPPYITHNPDGVDEERYQTVYAHNPGAVAAPTAGLHFDQAMLERLKSQGLNFAKVTLHVGAGTFQPVRVDEVSDHVMHEEHYHIPAATVEAIARTHAAGGAVIAVGTTSLRALESAARDGALVSGWNSTKLFITPGYEFRVVDRLITNFHLPRSTLLMLVSAFSGTQAIAQGYAHAVDQQYRFFSYGDAMLLNCMRSAA